MVPYFSLVLFKGIVRKQLTRMYTLKKGTLGCTEGALSGCTKAESLRTQMICFIENKNLQNYHRSLSLLCYMFCFMFIIKNIIQNSLRAAAPAP